MFEDSLDRNKKVDELMVTGMVALIRSMFKEG